MTLETGASPPVFEQIFRNARFAQGGNAHFEGKVKGNPTPQVIWTRKGLQMQNSDKHTMLYDERSGIVTLTINAIGPGDEGEYTCTALNPYGEAICTVYISPEATKQVKKSRSGQKLSKSSSSTSTSKQQMMFQQHQQQQQLYQQQQQQQQMYQQQQLQQQQQQQQQLQQQQLYQQQQQQQQEQQQQLYQQQQQQEMYQQQQYQSSQSMSFHQESHMVQESSSSISQYQQGEQRSQQQQMSSQKYEASFNANKQINGQSDQAMIGDEDKHLAPKFTSTPQTSVEVLEGDTVRLQCHVSGKPNPDIHWFLKGQKVIQSQRFTLVVNESGFRTFMINSAQLSDTGSIECVARNKSGEDRIQCQLTVHPKQKSEPPVFLEKLTPKQIRAGDPVQLRVRAIGDPSPTLTWLKDGFDIHVDNNVNIVHDSEGGSVLTINQATSHEDGWFQCTAINTAGICTTRARVRLMKPPEIHEFKQDFQLKIKKSGKAIQPEREQEPEVVYLKHVEQKAESKRSETEQTINYGPPSFVTPIKDLQVYEGERVHFEAKIAPAGDPSLTVEWFCNGQPIPASSRVNTLCQFGFVALDMLNSVVQDAGQYTCQIQNAHGSLHTSAKLTVIPRREVEPEYKGVETIQKVKAPPKKIEPQEPPPQPPQFVKHLQNHVECNESANIHLEAQINPLSDSTMKIDWLKDGKPITASSRIGTLFSFGYVSLNISGVRAEDAGIYLCRATNASGQAVSQAKIDVHMTFDLHASTGIAEQQQYIEKIQQLEQFQASKASTQLRGEEPMVEATEPPLFKTPIKDQVNVKESGFAHFEARLEPMGDASMKVEWFKDGKSVDASSRITTFFNFGYVALTIKQVNIHDAGQYSCVATNRLGRAETSAKLTTMKSTESEFQSQTWTSIQQMEAQKTKTQAAPLPEERTVKPRFLSQLKGTNVVVEGQRAHFELRLEPQNDSNLKVQWLHNGRELKASSRIQTYFDFGYVALDILDVGQEDSGTYTLVAANSLGREETSIDMRVEAHHQGVDQSTIHGKAVEEVKRFEMKQQSTTIVADMSPQVPPVFRTTLQNPQPVMEGQNIHLEARLEPINDPNMKLDWFCNGKPLTIGSRFRTYNDFGFIALDIVGVTARDEGQYLCRAVNKWGQAETSATVKVTVRSNVITESDHETAMQQISYLESETKMQHNFQSQQKFQAEEGSTQPPQFTKTLKNVEVVENNNVHMEARLVPTGDSTMQVEWTYNGQPLKTGHKFRPMYDFDYVGLDILKAYPEDSGVYTCTARNAYGQVQSSSNVKITAMGKIIIESSSQSRQFEHLETKQKSRFEMEEEPINQAPSFSSKMRNVSIQEGQRAHFECRLVPLSDPNLRVEWFHNGQPIKQGTRFREGFDFGFVSLDIMHTYPEDAGTYTCKAVNALGQSEASATLEIQGNKAIDKETIHEAALSQIHYLEKSHSRRDEEDGFVPQKPSFTCGMKDSTVTEGSSAHFEAKLMPVGDPNLRVEWYKDGRPIPASNRMSTLHDFGFVAFDLKYTRPGDSGTYSCKAINQLGEASLSATLKVMSTKDGPNAETLHGEALEKIAYLEHRPKGRREEEEDNVITAPAFTVPLKGKTSYLEGQNIHIECRIEPYPDSTLRVDWYHNNQPLPFGNRWKTSYDFGFASLDILGAYPEDAGTYSLVITNMLGRAESSLSLKVSSRGGLLLDSEHVDALEKIKYLESKHQRRAEEELIVPEVPLFGHPLKSIRIDEGQPAHFETTLTPVNDATMNVQWLFNGKSVAQGHRFRTTYDFGFVALDILYAYPEDSGTYTCTAANALGQIETSCSLEVKGKSGLLLDTLDSGRLTHLHNLEHRRQPRPEESDIEITAPAFKSKMNSVDGTLEQSFVHLECRLEPLNDPNLRVEWFVNGKEIRAGHRFRTTHDFGFVALDILYAYAEDSGTYTCRAVNKLGEAVNQCEVNVVAKKSLLLDSQHPEGWEKMKYLEQRGHSRKLEVEEMPVGPPHFVTELVGISTLREGNTAHFEAQIEPIHDPSLRVDFFHNGKPLQQGSRIHTLCDFGYVALDISGLVMVDEGQYTCKVTNSFGQSESSVTLNLSGSDSLDMSSMRPEGLEKISQLESRRQRAVEEDQKTFQKPVFTLPLQNVENEEGRNVTLAARLIPVGDPNLIVEWCKDGQVISSGSRINYINDFGCVTLDINGLRSTDEGMYECKARNVLGEAVTAASVKVATKGSLLLDSQHPEGMKKINALERGKGRMRAEEAGQTYDRPIFLTPLSGTTELEEGQNVHFECRVAPVGDPSIKFEWFCNDQKLKMGSRVQVTQDFGFVTLDIASAIDKDSGMYMVKASNLAGEATSSYALHVGGRGQIMQDSLHPDSFKKIQALEAQRQTKRQVSDDSVVNQPPVFMHQLKNVGGVAEGTNVHVQAAIEPKNDPSLSVEWALNGQPISSGSRLKTSLDFGHVQLFIQSARASDSGLYTCKAMNKLGEAVSTTSIKVEDAPWLASDSKHPSSMAKLAKLENKARAEVQSEDGTFSIPTFTQHMNDMVVVEGQAAKFECKINPHNDPNMRISWEVNGHSLASGSRIQSDFDFGQATLAINSLILQDAGIYSCVASNVSGTTRTSGKLTIKPEETPAQKSQAPESESHLDIAEKLDEAKTSTSFTLPDRPEMEEETGDKPIITRALHKEMEVKQDAKSLTLEFEFTPRKDPKLEVHWYHNGLPLAMGSRIQMKTEFGNSRLTISDLSDRDQGVYTCRIANRFGEASTFTMVKCSGKSSIDLTTKHPRGSKGLDAVAKLDAKDASVAQGEDLEVDQCPEFKSSFQSFALLEGERAFNEAILAPKLDSSMKVEWFRNGKQLEQSSRLSTYLSFGMVIFEIKDVRVSDAGVYKCVATNKLGTSESSFDLGVNTRQSSGQIPRFTSKFEALVEARQGQPLHLDCSYEPRNDSELQVQWKKNGQIFKNSSRMKTLSDFGFVTLDFLSVDAEDSGEYTCTISNKFGQESTSFNIRCEDASGVFYESLRTTNLNETNKQAILQLRTSSGDRGASSDATSAPKFLTQFDGLYSIQEGQSAHLEAKLAPADDANLQAEWFKDGEPIKMGHRFRTFHDFGIVILDILYCFSHDAGHYECRATNKLGSDSIETKLECSEKSSLVLTPQIPGEMKEQTLARIQNLETMKGRLPASEQPSGPGTAPRFTVPIANISGLHEGESAHFEARLIPTDDPTLNVQWFWNGKALKAGSRIRSFCDFGFVILEISPVYPEDSGEYICKATNAFGEAVTTASLNCSGKRNIIMDSQLPKGMQGAIDKIADLEGYGKMKAREMISEDTTKAPEFLTPLKDLTLGENSLAIFETRLTPINDPSMRVQWYHNGEALSAGSRIKTINDFGFVILEVANVLSRDSGTYTCKAVNKNGEASLSCTVSVSTKHGIVSDPQLPMSFRSGTDAIHRLEENRWHRQEMVFDEPEGRAPMFISQIQDVSISEGQPAHFDCRVEPIGDGSMRIDWFHNDKPLALGSRIHTISDFGFVVLDIDWTFQRDSGKYTCRATNKYGTVETSATMKCKSNQGINLDSQLPQGMSLDRLKELEKGKAEGRAEMETAEITPPKFITQIQSKGVAEGEPVHFNCRVEPKHDPKLEVKWYNNGKELASGHRFRITNEFGYVALDILYTYPEDEGEYVCQATNALGEDNTKCQLKCKELPAIQLENQVPKGMKRSEYVVQMEAAMKKYTQEIFLTEDDIYDGDKQQPPRFVTQIQSVTDLIEMQATKFECQLAPVGDPHMKVEWFFNNKPLQFKNRFTPIYDFGYVAMNFGWVYPEDSGEYVCRATNRFGSDETRGIIKTAGRPGIVYESQLPKGMASIDRIREMEAGWQRAPDVIEGETERFKPCFVTQPEAQSVGEGEMARFVCRVTGYPKPRVMWLLNGQTVINGSRHKLVYDGMWHFDVPRCRDTDDGKIEVIARNACGEAFASTTLTVKARQDDYRSVLKHNVKPWFDEDNQKGTISMEEREAAYRSYLQRESATASTHVSQIHQRAMQQHSSQTNTTSTTTSNSSMSVEAAEWQRMAISRRQHSAVQHFQTIQDYESTATSPPNFIRPMEPTNIHVGETCTFRVEFTGTPRPEVKWFRYSELIKSGERFKVIDEETSSNLVIKTSSTEDSGIFTCLLENPAGATKCSTNLSVLENEYSSSCVSVRTLNEKIIDEGDQIRFDFQFPQGTQEQLQFSLNDLPLDRKDQRLKVSFKDDIASLLITDAKPSDTGLYQCTMRDEQVKCQVKCTVQPKKTKQKA